MDDLKIYEIAFDDDNYMHFNIDADGYRLDGLFRILDPANGVSMELVSIDNGNRHPVISEQWENIEQQCKIAAAEKYNELIRMAQFKVISEFNPAPNEYQTWIRKAEDIKTFNDTLKDNDWEGWEINGFDDSYSAFDVENALQSGKIKVYSSHPIRQGVFVTPSYMEAYSYSGNGKVYSTVADLDDVAWIDPTQGQYAPVKHIKSMYSGEIEVYFDGDNVSITDKYNRQIKLQPADNYSYNNFEEYLNGIAMIYPEYRLFIENNFAELSNDYEKALQAASYEAESVRLSQLEADMYEGGGYGEDNANARAETEISRLRGNLIDTNKTELKSNKIRFQILEANSVTGYKYNVQVHFSYDTPENFVYSGMGRFCENLDSVNKYINRIKKEYSEYKYEFRYEGINEDEVLKLQSELENTKTSEKFYAPETSIYFESQKSFDELTIQNEIKYHFKNHHFSNITFTNENLVGDFKNCVFRNCSFQNFNGEHISFENSSFNNCVIINSNFKNCNFENAGLYQSQISKSDLTNANFATANMKRTRFDENNLSAVKFHGATLNGVIITEPTINKPIEGLFTENITWDGATYEEIETLRKNIFSRLKLEPVTFSQELEKSASSLEPLSEPKPQHNIKFVWNGIKIDGQLYKGNYYSGTYTETSNLPEGTITIHMDRSNTPIIESLEIENNSDSMTDYFETDTVRIKPDSIHYASAVTAANAYEIHMEKVVIRQYEKGFAKHLGTNMEEYYANELSKHKAKLSELEKKSNKGKSVRKNTVPQR